ncbi:hypothetical protein DASB73_032540 [Starmerella bacillaris]|uniref:Uncharacterized protein n=1 Tax=Starmerella bacillaris TaxID=1247836 RepID=A0AAV5RL60_STABA|nr:hypothetical protein DASB73_032540 [Starmerella bacillaris]
MSSDVSRTIATFQYWSLRNLVSEKKKTCSTDAIKVAYDSLQKLKQPSTPTDLKACIDMSKSPDAKFLEICITSLVLDSRNSVILDKIFDDIPCVLQSLLKRIDVLRLEEVNDFWRLLEALCTKYGRFETIESCFAHRLVAEYLKPEYRGCVDQLPLAIFTARIISNSKNFMDSQCQGSLDKISSSFFEVGKLYAPGIRYTLRCISVRKRLLSSKKIEFTPDSNLIDCALAIITIFTPLQWPPRYRDDIPMFVALLKSSTVIYKLGLPEFPSSSFFNSQNSEFDGKRLLIELFLKVTKFDLISDYSLFLPLLITWIQEEDFKSETKSLDRAVVLLIRILERDTNPITPSQYELVFMELLSLMERYTSTSAAQVSWMDLDMCANEELCKETLEVLDSIMGDEVLSYSQKQRLYDISQQLNYRIKLPDRIARQLTYWDY